MTNWELVKDKIAEECNNLIEKEKGIGTADAYFFATITIANKHNANVEAMEEAIDWLTQEATVCKYCKDDICELRTIDRECFGTEDLMECCGMLTQQEAKKEELKYIGNEEELKEYNYDLDRDVSEKEKNEKPQQSKARFIECCVFDNKIKRVLVNANHIARLLESENEKGIYTEITTFDKRHYRVYKPINEVIQKLGIEVV